MQTPPHDLYAEKSILGSILIDHKCIIKIADMLDGEDFYAQKNGLIYEAMRKLFSSRSPIDLTTLSSELENQKVLEKIGGRAYLSEVVAEVPTSSHILRYATIIKEKSTLRKLIQVGEMIKGYGYEEDKDLPETLEKSEKAVIGISKEFIKNEFTHIKDILHSTHDRVADIHERVQSGENVTRGVPTGFFDLDKILSGLQPSDLLILAARPAMGKTSLMLNIAQHVAVKEKKNVGIFSLEMSKDQLVERMLSSLMGIDSWKLRTGNLNDKDFQNMAVQMDRMAKCNIFIDDNADCNILEMRTKCRRLQSEHGLDAIFIDYLQLMKGQSKGANFNRVLEIAEISRSLKIIGRELNIPVVALSQLSRGVESRPDKRPMLSDLRDSGAIEQDADVVMFVYRDEYYYPDTTDNPGIAEIIIGKHRHGATGKIELAFNGKQMKFSTIAKHR